MTAVPGRSPRRYEFGSAAEDDTLVLGLRAGQVVIVAGGLLGAVVAIRASSDTTGLVTAIAVLAVAAITSFWSIGGRTIEQWLPIGSRWAYDVVTGRHRHRSDLPLTGETSRGDRRQVPPPNLDGIRLLAAPGKVTAGREVGIVHDRRTGTFGAVLAVQGGAFQLLDTPEKERRLAAWGAILAGLARASSPVERLQWVERTVPDDADAQGRYLAATVAVDRAHPSLASYLQLVDQAGPASPKHETLLVVSISALKARRAIRQAGGGDQGAATVLLREVTTLARQLAAAEVAVEGLLTPRLLAAAIRHAYDPAARATLARRAAAAGDAGGTDPANAWPLAADATWSSYRTDGAWHATYWVAHWPRTAVGPDFLAPLLLGTTGMRSVALTMQPVPPLKAHRQVEQAVLKQAADDELRARAGFTTTARRRRSRESVERREQELADGHADYRLAGYVTVTAGSPDALDAACGEIEQAAQQAHLELRRMYGQQDLAFTYTLPLARGLR